MASSQKQFSVPWSTITFALSCAVSGAALAYAALRFLETDKDSASAASSSAAHPPAAPLVRSGALSLPRPPSPRASSAPVRVYVDGCFDLFHVGHSNALRQARACGDYLIVGLVGDAEIEKNKGSAPVMNEAERFAALSACKWVDEVVRDVPYDLSEAWVDGLLRDHRIDFIAHGDDPCITADGKDAYAYAKSIGVYREFKRTEGASTTDIVGRMLLMTRDHHLPAPAIVDARDAELRSSTFASQSVPASTLALSAPLPSSSPITHSPIPSAAREDAGVRALLAKLPHSQHLFLPTARRITQFSEGRVPKPGDRVVYVCGSWDLFNSGHIAALVEARDMGDFLLVGVHDDATVNRLRGHGLPILNLYERTLSLLSCKYVDEVIIGAPFVISEELIKTMNISVVAKGSVSDIANSSGHSAVHISYDEAQVSQVVAREYEVPQRLGILREFRSTSPLTALTIIERIIAQRAAFQRRFDKKSKSEEAYIQNKSFVAEI